MPDFGEGKAQACDIASFHSKCHFAAQSVKWPVFASYASAIILCCA
jgi:hypothetical protein